MVMTVAASSDIPRSNRSYIYTITLWCIPIITWALIIAVFLLNSKPKMVNLVQLDNPAQFSRITQKLDKNGINYETLNQNTILVEKSQKPRAVINLASEKLPGDNSDNNETAE